MATWLIFENISSSLTLRGVARRSLSDRPCPVPRTRSSHHIAAGTVANFGFISGSGNHRVASVLFDAEVRSEVAANACELRNRETSVPHRGTPAQAGSEDARQPALHARLI